MKPTADKELKIELERILKPYLWTVLYDIDPYVKIINKIEELGYYKD